MDFNSLIQLKRDRFDQLERDIADPALFSNRQRAKAIMRDHATVTFGVSSSEIWMPVTWTASWLRS